MPQSNSTRTPAEQNGEVFVQSMVGSQGRGPFVSIRINDRAPFIVSAEAARTLASNIVNAAAVAEADAALINWMIGQGASLTEAGRCLKSLRDSREGGKQ